MIIDFCKGNIKMYDIGIIGNGFVGSAISAGFVLHVNDIFIYDVDPAKSTTTLQSVLDNSQFIFVCVPTPMKPKAGGEIDTSILDTILYKINRMNRRNNVIIIKSTIIPGTMERYIEEFPLLNLVFNPEFLTERRARLDFINASRVVLGGKDELVNRVEKLYRDRFPVVPILKTDVATAQLIKYMVNCFFAVKISYMNEIKQLSDIVGANWDDTIEGFISDGRIGNSHIDVPGHDGDVGFGGKCFPKDINALIYKCKQVGVTPHVTEAAWKKNKEVRSDLDWYDIPGAVAEEE